MVVEMEYVSNDLVPFAFALLSELLDVTSASEDFFLNVLILAPMVILSIS